jgi:hypothetical protein
MKYSKAYYMPASELKLLLIGGFAFNDLPLKGVSELFGEDRFIDINQFNDDYTLEMMADKLIQIQSQYMGNYIVAFSMGGLGKYLEKNASSVYIFDAIGNKYLLSKARFSKLRRDYKNK